MEYKTHSLAQLIAVLTLILLAPAATAEHEADNERRRDTFNYYYYPEYKIYYSTDRDVYFYRQSGKWKKSRNLPLNITLYADERITLTMRHRKPYRKFRQHKRKYPADMFKTGNYRDYHELYDYYYYPEQQVYYDIDKDVYYYRGWTKSNNLPSHIYLYDDERVTVTMEHGKPYDHFDEHKKEYPKNMFAHHDKQRRGQHRTRHVDHRQSNHGYYDYYYYPEHQVYFDISRAIYHFKIGGKWKTSIRLPSKIKLFLDERVTVKLKDRRPHRYFSKHKLKFPKNMFKKHTRKRRKSVDHRHSTRTIVVDHKHKNRNKIIVVKPPSVPKPVAPKKIKAKKSTEEKAKEILKKLLKPF